MASTTGVEKLVIIGSGPAGWTAAIYAARANLSPLSIVGVPKQDPGPVLPGGQLMLTTEVENYPGFEHGVMGPEMMGKFQAQAERFGTRIMGDDVVRCDFSKRPFELHTQSNGIVRAHAVIIATGATANWIGLPNEMRLAPRGQPLGRRPRRRRCRAGALGHREAERVRALRGGARSPPARRRGRPGARRRADARPDLQA